MNEGEAAYMASDLPQEILVSILVRLPVKLLLRFRCVCKSWCSLIADPLFISAHSNQQSTAGTPAVLVRRGRAGFGAIRYTLNSDDDSLTHIAEFSSPFPNGPNPSTCPRILGAVNGLICLLGGTYALMLWNPAIRKSLTLPSPIFDLSLPRPPCFGFGFSPLLNDYKVVKIDHGSTGPCVEVYSLSAGSWSGIELNQEAVNLPLLYPRQAYLNGVVRWIGYDSTIVGFDILTETFRTLQLPGELKGKRMDDVGIAAWCGYLALFELENSTKICLWVLKVYDNVESWIRQCVICSPTDPYSPLRVKGIGSHGRILVECFELYWFDPWTQETAKLNIQDVGGESLFHVKSYTESLFLLDSHHPTVSTSYTESLFLLDSQHPTVSTLTPSSTRKRKRWSDEEEKLLVRAWLNARKGGGDRIWRQIETYFGGQRDLNQLKQHWYAINNSVSKFHSCYKKLCDQLQNGSLDENDGILWKAFQAYRDEERVRFKHEHVWRLLKDEPRWNGSESSEKGKSSSKRKGKEKLVEGPEAGL